MLSNGLRDSSNNTKAITAEKYSEECRQRSVNVLSVMGLRSMAGASGVTFG